MSDGPRMWALVLEGVSADECEAMEARLRAILATRGSADELCVRPAARVEEPGLYESAIVAGRDVSPEGVQTDGQVAGWILRSGPGEAMFERWIGLTR